MADQEYRSAWMEEDDYWRANFASRPYASASGRDYLFYQPAYRYGYESAQRYGSRTWNDIESMLSTDWITYEHRSTSTWEEIKGAVRDAWDRVTGKRPVGAR